MVGLKKRSPFNARSLKLLILVLCSTGTAAQKDCSPIYVRWPRVRLNLTSRVSGPYSVEECARSCSKDDHPGRPGYPLQCSGFNQKRGGSSLTQDCQMFQKDQIANLDGNVESDDRYSFFWKYCVKTTAKCKSSYQFDFHIDRYMDYTESKRRLSTFQIEDCLSECLEETSFECRSVSFNRTAGYCYLSSQSQLSKPSAVRINNNPNYRIDYYENKCLNDCFTFHHDCQTHGVLVTVEAKFPYSGAMYGMYDYFTCRVEPKEEMKFQKFFPFTSMSKNCSDSMAVRDKEYVLDVVLSTDNVEPLYFLTDEDTIYRAKCPTDSVLHQSGSTVGAQVELVPSFSRANVNAILEIGTTNVTNKSHNFTTTSLFVTSTLASISTLANSTVANETTAYTKTTVFPKGVDSSIPSKKPLQTLPAIDVSPTVIDKTESTETVPPAKGNKITLFLKYPNDSSDSTTIRHSTITTYAVTTDKTTGRSSTTTTSSTTEKPTRTSGSTSTRTSTSTSTTTTPTTSSSTTEEPTTTIATTTEPETTTSTGPSFRQENDSGDITSSSTVTPTTSWLFSWRYRFDSSSSATAASATTSPTSKPFKKLTPSTRLEPTATSSRPSPTTETTTKRTISTSTSDTFFWPTTSTIAYTTSSGETTSRSTSTTSSTTSFDKESDSVTSTTTSFWPFIVRKSTTPDTSSEEDKSTTTSSTQSSTTSSTEATTTTSTTTPASTTSTQAGDLSTTTGDFRDNSTTRTISNTTTAISTASSTTGSPATTASPKKVAFDIFHNGQSVSAVVVGSRISLSFTPSLALSGDYLNLVGCQVEPVNSPYSWERDPLQIVKNGCQADGVGLLCPPVHASTGVTVEMEAFRYTTTGEVLYSCLVRVCAYGPCPQALCNAVDGCEQPNANLPNVNIPVAFSSPFASFSPFSPGKRRKRQATPLPVLPFLSVSGDLQQNLIALAGDHVVSKKLVVVNSESELHYYLRTGNVPNSGSGASVNNFNAFIGR